MPRTFVLLANRAVATGNAPLADLAGAGGRFDLVTRFALAGLLTSHGIRRDATVVVLFTNTPGEPKALRIAGDSVQGLGPDERSSAAVLQKALVPVPMPVWMDAGQGIENRTVTLEALLDELPDPVLLLDEGGEELQGDPPSEGSFVLGDQDGLTQEQRAAVAKRAARAVSVGPVALQADHVVAVLNNVLDRAGT